MVAPEGPIRRGQKKKLTGDEKATGDEVLRQYCDSSKSSTEIYYHGMVLFTDLCDASFQCIE